MELDVSQLASLDVNKIPEDKLDEVLFKLKSVVSKDTSEYEPYDKQEEFHLSDKHIRCMFGGNRSGKTFAGTMEALMHATGRYPAWYPEALKIAVPNKGRIVVSDFAKGFNENLEPYFKKWLPSSMIKSVRKNHEGYPAHYELTNGSKFDICTHEQDQKIFEGWSGHWAWFDEPPPREKFIATLRGLVDYGGRTWLTLTPLSEPWMWDELVCAKGKDTFVITVDSHDNPFLKPERLAQFESKLKPEERDARIQGKFLHLSGLVYKTLDKNIHMRKLNLQDKESPYHNMSKTWYFILDPHDRRAHCGIWAFVNPNEKKYVAYQLNHDSDNLDDLVAYILATEKTLGIPSSEVIRIGDPNKFLSPNAETRMSLKLAFLERDDRMAFITSVDDSILRGHMRVKDALSYNKEKPIDPLNSPEIYFNDEEFVPNVWEDFLRYMYQEWKGVTKESKNPKETPKEAYKDFPDCVRYFLMFNPTYQGSSSSQDFSPLLRRRTRTGY